MRKVEKTTRPFRYDLNQIPYDYTLKESEVAQSCPTLCDSMDCSLPGSSLHRIPQAKVLEWVAISFSRDLPDPGIEPGSPAFQADTLTSEPPGKPSVTETIAIRIGSGVCIPRIFVPKVQKYPLSPAVDLQSQS